MPTETIRAVSLMLSNEDPSDEEVERRTGANMMDIISARGSAAASPAKPANRQPPRDA